MNNLLSCVSWKYLISGKSNLMPASTHQEIVFGILKHHVDRFVFQNDLSQRNKIPMMQLSIQLGIALHGQLLDVLRQGSLRGSSKIHTIISRAPLWLIPAYVCTSPSLSGLNFLIAKTSPSFAERSPGRIHSSGWFRGSRSTRSGAEAFSLDRDKAVRVMVGSVDPALFDLGGGSNTALYTRPYVPQTQGYLRCLADSAGKAHLRR